MQAHGSKPRVNPGRLPDGTVKSWARHPAWERLNPPSCILPFYPPASPRAQPQSCAALTTLCFQNILVTPKRNPTPTSSQSPSLPPRRPWQPRTSLLSGYGFVCSGHFMYMESNHVWSFMSGFFHLASCFPGSAVL